MSINQSPTSRNTIASGVQKFIQRIIAHHPSITSLPDKRRVQLSLSIEAVISILLVAALLARPSSTGIFVLLLAISFSAFLLGKSANFRTGIYVFTYGFTLAGFLRAYQGTATSIETVIFSTVTISILVSSILLSRRGFIGLLLLTTFATILVSNQTNPTSGQPENIMRTVGILITIGAILLSSNIYRDNLDKDKLAELDMTNTALEDAKANLEKSVFDSDRKLQLANQQIQLRAARLKTILELSKELTDNSSLGLIDSLTKITQSISEKLGYYHIGIFLMDRNQEYAVLRAANSKGGQQLLGRGHQLRAGGTGVVGYASQSGRIRIALDTGSDAVYFNNPDLPDTRSEIAIPLKHGTSIVGVLDVQSKLPSAFNDEDIHFLSILANQIAADVKNKTGSGIGSRTNAGQSSNLSRRQRANAYTYNPDGTITSTSGKITSTSEKSLASGEVQIVQPLNPEDENPALAIPVKYREEIIGIINVESNERNRYWSEDEIALVQAIADRAALALENARLFENATQRAEQEQTIAQVTNQIGSSTDFDIILQNTIQELGRALGTSRSFIQLSVPSDDQEAWNKSAQDRK